MDLYLDMGEQYVHLGGKKGVYEGVLATTIPDIQHKVVQEPHIRLLNLNRSSKSPRVTRYVVGKDDAPHAGLTWVWSSGFSDQNIRPRGCFCQELCASYLPRYDP